LYFIPTFAKITLVPDLGGTWFLPRLVGKVRARALTLTGESVPSTSSSILSATCRKRRAPGRTLPKG